MPGKDRQETSESSPKASIASCGDAEDSVVPAHLIELGQQALAESVGKRSRCKVRRLDRDVSVTSIEQSLGTVSRYDARGRHHQPKSVACICCHGSIITELFRLEDHLLYIPRQDISGDVPIRLDVSAVGPPNRVGHRVCDKLPKRPQS